MSHRHHVIFLLAYMLNITNSQVGVENLLNEAVKPLRPINPDTAEHIINNMPENVANQLTPALDILKKNGITTTYNVKTVKYPTRQVYDFIVIGAGTAGATLANRLSENKNFTVLLIEAGESETLFSQIPFFIAIQLQTDFNYGYRIEKQRNACFGMKDQRCTWPRGKSLGGTSSLNAMLHTRGNQMDYDDWAKLGNVGWSYKEVLPYFIKSENYRVEDGKIDHEYHGTKGYVHVENIPYRSNLARAFLKASKELGYGVTDINGKQQLGSSYLPVNMVHGARCSSARAYLRVNRTNLDIVAQAFVTKILINDEKRAYGVKYVKNGQTRTVRASKEVISCAGTVNGAQLLMLSGIGPKEHLKELGIKVIKDARVGYNMYEHIATWGLLFETNSTEPFTIKTVNPGNIIKYALNREGPLSSPAGCEAISFIKTKLAPDARPDMEILFFSGGVHSDKGLGIKPGYGISDKHYSDYFRPIEHKHLWSIWPIIQHPRSVGRLTLQSKNPFEHPILDPNFFSDPDDHDLETALEGLKYAIKLSKTKAFQRYNSKVYDKQLLGCEHFEVGTDDYYKCLIKTLPVMENHEMGTCKMGNASDLDAVVDPRLRVYGIDGLRVIDASVMPTMPTGHINAGVYMIGEKGADMVKEDYENSYINSR